MKMSHVVLCAALLLVSTGVCAQANRIPADTAPTAGVSDPTPLHRPTQPTPDSTLAGGSVVALPGGEWSFGSGSGSGAGTPPPVPGPGLLKGGKFTAITSHSYNARAWIDIFIRANGTCEVVTHTLKDPGHAGGGHTKNTYSCGTWLPSGGSPGSYEVQFVASENPLVYGNPYYTKTTGWLSLSTDQSAIADARGPSTSIEVDFYVRIRAAGASSYVESGPFTLFAEAEAF